MTERARRAPYELIDGDSHVGMPLDLWDRYLDEEFKKRPDRPRHEVHGEDQLAFFRCGRYSFPPLGFKGYMPPSGRPPGPLGGIDADTRVREFMDPEGIDRTVLMPSRNIAPSYLGDPELGNAMVEAYNDWLRDMCKEYPARMFGYGILNAADTIHAVREMRRSVFELGFPGVYVNPNVIGNSPDEYHTLASEHYFPIYEAAQELGVPVAIHGFSDPYIEGFDRNWPNRIPLWSDINGFPMQGMNCFLSLVAGGVCETFPELRLGIFESGVGWVPLLLDRLHERMEKFAPMVADSAPKLKLEPKEYIQRQIYFGFEPEDPFVELFIQWTGAPNRLIFSADYPHLDFEPGQTEEYLHGRKSLNDEVKRLTLHDNSIEFFRWEDTAASATAEAPDGRDS